MNDNGQPKKASKPKAKVKSPTAPPNSHLGILQKIGQGIEGLMDPEKKNAGSKRKRALYEKQAALMKSISFYKEFPADENFQASMKEEMKEFGMVTAEIKALLNEEANAATNDAANVATGNE